MARPRRQVEEVEEKEVQHPQERGPWQFETLEVLQFVVQPVVIAKDKRGKKLGVVNLPQQMLYEVEDVIEWLNNFEDNIEDPEYLEALRGGLVAQRNGQRPPDGAL